MIICWVSIRAPQPVSVVHVEGISACLQQHQQQQQQRMELGYIWALLFRTCKVLVCDHTGARLESFSISFFNEFSPYFELLKSTVNCHHRHHHLLLHMYIYSYTYRFTHFRPHKQQLTFSTSAGSSYGLFSHCFPTRFISATYNFPSWHNSIELTSIKSTFVRQPQQRSSFILEQHADRYCNVDDMKHF